MKKVHNVVMLPTEKASRLFTIGGDRSNLKYALSIGEVRRVSRLFDNQHLYITSDDEIKEGDWCIAMDTYIVFKVTSQEMKGIKSYSHIYKKVIASTYDLIIGYTEQTHPTQDNSKQILLPQIPESFIKEYVKNPVDEVMVEYEQYSCRGFCTEKNYDSYCEDSCVGGLKLNNNQIIISPVEEKMYTKEEIISKIEEFEILHRDGWDLDDFNKWMKKNL